MQQNVAARQVAAGAYLNPSIFWKQPGEGAIRDPSTGVKIDWSER